MINEMPFSGCDGGIQFLKLWEDHPMDLMQFLPVTNPVDDILSIRAFEVMQLCWNLDPEKRPKMIKAQSQYDMMMHPTVSIR